MADGIQDAGARGFPGDLLRPYRPGQGLVARRIALAVGVGFALWAAFDLWVWLHGFAGLSRPLLDGALARLPLGGPPISGSLLIAAGAGGGGLVLVLWLLKRPWLADLFIDTEAEMKKVSWPAREEAWAATKVVTATVVTITLVLLVFDLVLTEVMRLLTGLRI
jgi:preprotein translocase SecE subunit